jgi:prevent-host-death family protein
MMTSWQLQVAKARLSELLRAAREQGPQQITLHGAAAAVLLSREDYERLAGPQPGLLALVQGSPLHGSGLAAALVEARAVAGGRR